jgi:hypothetical protein
MKLQTTLMVEPDRVLARRLARVLSVSESTNVSGGALPTKFLHTAGHDTPTGDTASDSCDAPDYVG